MIDRKTFLKRLNLRNFRRFEAITLDLDPGLTLLVAENGGGKTAMLDGVALALWDFERDVLGLKSSRATNGECHQDRRVVWKVRCCWPRSWGLAPFQTCQRLRGSQNTRA